VKEKAGLFNLTTGLTAVKFTQASHLLLQGLQCSAVLRLEEANRRRILPRGGRSSHIGVDDGTWSTHTTPCGIFFPLGDMQPGTQSTSQLCQPRIVT